ncbi:MAG: hypothetical protein DHS20C18_07810 [Saprospiraceae bacterium]|nr:MAG: hypothetical protein DHS20C18_07810 [Saprospiraceae bacterium]
MGLNFTKHRKPFTFVSMNPKVTMKKIPFVSLCFLLGLLLYSACKNEPIQPEEPGEPDYLAAPSGTTPIPANQQRNGDAEAGREYLLYGDYVSSGIPIDVFNFAFDGDGNLLNRTGDNADLPYDFTAINASNGVRIAAANCFTCHAQVLDGQLILGLGNSLADFTDDQSSVVPTVDAAINFLHGANSPEREAYEPFRRSALVTGPLLIAETKGVNPAAELTAILAAHRDPQTLEWQADPSYEIGTLGVPSDVPAWWLLKKKNAQFYNGAGRGDFTKFTMASGMLTLKDSAEASAIYQHFGDVLAFLFELEAPDYPEVVDATKVAQGESLFYKNCAKCHGTYGDSPTYPNLLVASTTIGTDPLYAQTATTNEFFLDWWNNGWFGQALQTSWLQPFDGYIAPPLDGIWATAPYLHNGSVPNLETLLNSSKRPTYWRRSFTNPQYDYSAVGWQFTIESSGNNKAIYDTTLPGYGNQGHVYGDVFTDEERSAVIEYLKTI